MISKRQVRAQEGTKAGRILLMIVPQLFKVSEDQKTDDDVSSVVDIIY